MSTQRKVTASTAALGVDNVQRLVHMDNSIFNKIDQDNDVGTDAYVEFVENQMTTGCCMALQIKSGASYVSADGKTFYFKTDKNHFEYWSNHSLPVGGVVYDPTRDLAVWCDITAFLTNNPYAVSLGPFTIPIPVDHVLDTNTFAEFKRHFLAYHGRYSSDSIFGRTLDAFANFADHKACYAATQALFSFHRERFATWYYLWGSLKNFRGHPLLRSLVVRLAHIPAHGDIFWGPGNWISNETAKAVKAFMKDAIGRDEMLVLLESIDDDGFQRGSVGQCVWCVVSVVRRRFELLRSILEDKNVPVDVRYSALWLLVAEIQDRSKDEAVGILQEFAPSFSDEMNQEMIQGMIASLRQGVGLSLW
jgi:hypothetical protein